MGANWVGIDYGSKIAGTTVACYAQRGGVCVAQSEKKKDADEFLKHQVAEIKPTFIFLDAPLSLPNVYAKGQLATATDDYFYRACDRQLGAMSPMFLGGLTARAMKLATHWQQQGVKVCETYPAALAAHWQLKTMDYKGDIAAIAPVVAFLQTQIPMVVRQEDFTNWHRVDALLAFVSGYRFMGDSHICLGDAGEGQIFY